MLPQFWRCPIQRQFRIRECHRAAHALDPLGGDLHTARLHLGVGKDLGQIVDRACGHALRFAGGQQVSFVPCLGGRCDKGRHLGPIFDSRGIAGNARMRGSFCQPQNIAQFAILAVIARGHINSAIFVSQ